MAAKATFEVFELTPGCSPAVVTAAARTICHAFSDDPLIAWLRPNKDPWNKLEKSTLEWQRRRVYQSMVDGRVFGVCEISSAAGSRLGGQDARLPAVVFVSGPCSPTHWLSRLPTRLWLWTVQILSPVVDGADEKRIATMMREHDSALAALKVKLKMPMHYIEVVAVDPSRQGQGLGSLALRHVLATAGKDAALALESTKEQSLPFYAKQGFVEEKQVVLTASQAGEDAKESVQLWVMLRHPESLKTRT